MLINQHVDMNVEKVRQLIHLHPSISQLEIASNLGLDLVTVHTIINDFLHLGQINRRWTPTTLTAIQRTERLDWSNFVLEKSKHPNRFIARFDTWIYKHTDHWIFSSNTISNEKFAIACFYTITGIRAVASISDLRLLSSPDILDNCLGNDVKEKRFLYVDSSAYNSTILLDCLHDRKVVLVALPECSPDLMLGEPFLDPTFWSNLRKRRFDTYDEGLKEYKNCISKAVGGMGSKMFERWFERIQKCVRNEGDYVEQINFNVHLSDYNASRKTVMKPNALAASQVSVHTPTPNLSSEEPTTTNIATMADSCVDWHFKEPKLEPKEKFHYEDEEPVSLEYSAKFNDNEQVNIKLAIPSNGGYRLVTGPQMLANGTIVARSPQPIVPQQWRTTGLQVDGLQNLRNNVQTRVVTRQQQQQQQQRQAAASAVEDLVSKVSAQNEVDGSRNLKKDRNVETQSDTQQQQQQQQQLACTAEATIKKKDYPKPAYSYSCLCVLAIKNSHIGAMPVTAIYRFIREHFPYFKTAPKAWKNSLRHNLSQNNCFKKIGTATAVQPNKRRNFWVIDPLKAEKKESELQKKTKKHLENIRKAMSHPENLDLLVRGEMKFVTDFSEDTEDSSDDLEIHNEMIFASQLKGSSASDDGCNVSQDDEIDIVDDNKEALRVQLNLIPEYVPIPVAKRQKTLAGTMKAVYVSQPAKGRKMPLVYRADPLLEMIK